MKQSTFTKGRAGEALAAQEIERQGMQIVARNFRSIAGEIDLIGIDGETLVFIEVKCWSRYNIDTLEQSLNEKKRKRIIETAKFFLQSHRKYRDMAIRFDIIFIGRQSVLTHLTSAWTENI